MSDFGLYKVQLLKKNPKFYSLIHTKKPVLSWFFLNFVHFFPTPGSREDLYEEWTSHRCLCELFWNLKLIFFFSPKISNVGEVAGEKGACERAQKESGVLAYIFLFCMIYPLQDFSLNLFNSNKIDSEINMFFSLFSLGDPATRERFRLVCFIAVVVAGWCGPAGSSVLEVGTCWKWANIFQILAIFI